MIRILHTRRTRARSAELGPRDHGRVVSESQYLRSTDAPGCVTEVFDGVVHVSPSPVPTHGYWHKLLYRFLDRFSMENPDVFNHVDRDNDVVISARSGVTRPRPDITAYRGFPPPGELAKYNDWSYFCPVLVVEIVSARRRQKDIARNRGLYWAAGGIAEYWIVDPLKDWRRPALIALAREAGRPDWTERRVAFGTTYKSTTMDGLTINLKTISAG